MGPQDQETPSRVMDLPLFLNLNLQGACGWRNGHHGVSAIVRRSC
jgi:hypothetical protein